MAGGMGMRRSGAGSGVDDRPTPASTVRPPRSRPAAAPTASSSGGFGADGAAGTDAGARTESVTRVWLVRPLPTSTSACATALATAAVCLAAVPVAVISMTGVSGEVDVVTCFRSSLEPSAAAALSATGPVVTIRPNAWAKLTAVAGSPGWPVTTT